MSTMTTETATMILSGVRVLFGALAEGDYVFLRSDETDRLAEELSTRWWQITEIDETKFFTFLYLINSAGAVRRVSVRHGVRFYLHRYSARRLGYATD